MNAEARRTTLQNARTALRLPRSRFAVLLQIGSERLASYEFGRAPWPDALYAAAVEAVKADIAKQQQALGKLVKQMAIQRTARQSTQPTAR